MNTIDERLEEVAAQTELIPAVKAAVTDQNQQLADHEQRIATLEQAA